MPRSRSALICAVLLVSPLVTACGGRWFASPSALQDSVSTTITGVVNGAASASSAVRASSRSASTPSGEWTISVVGTNMTATIDESGRFQLSGVPTGNLELRITGPGFQTTIFVTNVGPQQLIQVEISLTGDTAVVVNEVRSSGKITLCHREDNASYHAIDVSVSAEPAHRAHGDGEVGDVVPADPTKVFSASCRPVPPVVSIKKSTNGVDADSAPGPSVAVGSAITWQYVVTNTGSQPLTNVMVTDSDPTVTVNCGQTTLAAGASMTCTASGVAVAGQYRNVGRVRVQSPSGVFTDTDASHYFGVSPDQGDDGPKVQLCHRTGNGSYHMIEVSVSAEAAHRSHGDGKVGEAVPGQAGKSFTASCGVQ